MRAHLVQLDISWENKAANYRRVCRLLDRAKDLPAPGDLIVLPEMFDTGFSFNLEKTADTDSQTLKFLLSLASETKCTIVGSRTVVTSNDKAEVKGKNRCTICAPTADGSSAVLCEYDKIHPFTFGKEAQFFTGGSRIETFTPPNTTSHTNSPTICPTICYDLRFPELFRLGLLKGAEVFTVIANWPAARAHHRRALTIARAIENQAIVLCVNRAGNDPTLSYQGGSLAVGPKGDIIAELSIEEAVLSVELDLAALRTWREQFTAWRDIKLIGS
jgi:omega-amidase